jgi:hypothetical protein
VIRSFLPSKEILIGETIQTIDGLYGNVFNTDMGPIVPRDASSPDFFNTAGAHNFGATDPLSVTFSDEFSPYDPSTGSATFLTLMAVLVYISLMLMMIC